MNCCLNVAISGSENTITFTIALLGKASQGKYMMKLVFTGLSILPCYDDTYRLYFTFCDFIEIVSYSFLSHMCRYVSAPRKQKGAETGVPLMPNSWSLWGLLSRNCHRDSAVPSLFLLVTDFKLPGKDMIGLAWVPCPSLSQ